MASDYVPDRLFARLFQPWTLPEAEWPLCREDWARVNAICELPWKGRLLDVGSGDGTLAAMVCSRSPTVALVTCVEPDIAQQNRIADRWAACEWPLVVADTIEEAASARGPFDGLLCCEVLEHLTPADGLDLLTRAVKLCKPGALVCVTVPHPRGERAQYHGHINVMSNLALEQMIVSAGVTISWHRSIHGPILGDYPIWITVVGRA